MTSTNATWKQPIPVSVYEDFGEDYLCMNLYIHLLLRAANKHRVIKLGKKLITVERGEVIFGRRTFAKFILSSGSGIEKSLRRLEKMHEKVTTKVTSNHTIVSIVNYDEIVSMDGHEWPVKEPVRSQRGASEEPVRNTNKSVRVKSVRVEDNPYMQDLEEKAVRILKKWNEVKQVGLKSVRGFAKNLAYWLEIYSVEEIEQAIENSAFDDFWKGITDILVLFRRKNPRGEDVDNIGKLLNIGKIKEMKLTFPEFIKAVNQIGKTSFIGSDKAEKQFYALFDKYTDSQISYCLHAAAKDREFRGANKNQRDYYNPENLTNQAIIDRYLSKRKAVN